MARSLPRQLGLLGILVLAAAALAYRLVRCDGDQPSRVASGTLREAAGQPSAGPAPAASTLAPIPDARLAGAIEEAIANDPLLHARGIHASVTDGAVTIAGHVGTLAADWRARRLVSGFKGARSIVDLVAIDAPSRPDADIAKEASDALASDPATRSAKVKATASGATLTLSGTADSYSQRDATGDVASRVPGVRQVNLNVTVPRTTVRPDTEVAAAVSDELREDVRLDGVSVTASAHGGITTLSGFVGSLAQRDDAVADARDAGTGDVDAQALHVDWRAAASGPAATRPLPTDDAIASAVRRRLSADANVGEPMPAVHVERGFVTLSGSVQDFRAARAARHDARRASGVREVNDGMTIAPVKRQGDATIQKLVMRTIFEDVAAPDARNVQVTTTDAKVTLEGTVGTEEDRKVIEDDAEEVPGVVAVHDQLQVQGFGAQTLRPSPESLRHRVIEAIFWDPRVPEGDVTVQVDASGDVTLAGHADTWGQAQAAGDDAVRAGAARVVNRIGVAGGSP